jgi:hypothetical protein
MKWYTLDDGRLCLGTDQLQFANFHVATEFKLNTSLEKPLNVEHIQDIGSYPEDWYNDESIDQKINQTAKKLFSDYL